MPTEVRLEAVGVGGGAPLWQSVGVVGKGYPGVVAGPRVRVGLEGGCCMVVVAAGMGTVLLPFIARCYSSAAGCRRDG